MECHYYCPWYFSNIGSAQFYCTDYSVEENWSTGARSYDVVLPGEGPYYIGNTGNAWIEELVRGGGGEWSLLTVVNLTTRSDIGVINSSPLSSLTPLIKLQKGCNHTIAIPVNDPDGDTVRCRWASGNAECANVCHTFKDEGAVIDEAACTIDFYAKTEGWHAVAITIEDFPRAVANPNALSKVPLQFLVLVFESDQLCAERPKFVGSTPADKACIGVPFNTTWAGKIVARTSDAVSRITEINTISPSGLTKSSVVNDSSEAQDNYITVTWSPLLSQDGSNIFCFTASDSIGLSSTQRCITLLGGVDPPYIKEDSFSPVGNDVMPTHSKWTLKFDKQFVRPTERSVFVRFFTSSGNEVLKIDTSDPRDAVFPISPGDRTLEIRTNFEFEEKETYYVHLEQGVVKGAVLCGAESLAMYNDSLWRFTIKDLTSPTFIFTKNPLVTNSTAEFSWRFDEQVDAVCTLQLSTSPNPQSVNCNNYWIGTDLPEGLHTLFIDATDLSGNVAPSVHHDWRVDLTPPIMRLHTSRDVITNKDSYTFSFECNEDGCTMYCKVVYGQNTVKEGDCTSGNFMVSGLVNERQYNLKVTPTDSVGNTGNDSEIILIVDKTPPTLSGISSPVSLVCGANIFPNNSALGTPTITDNIDQSPIVKYTDTADNGCSLDRVWTGYDEAGNTKAITQKISFYSLRPPTITFPADTVVPCSAASELNDQAAIIRQTVQIDHPCGRPITVTYRDSTDDITRCGYTFSRTWTITDDCGQSATSDRPQSIRILPSQFPEYPKLGQINVALDARLAWPYYPDATKFELYVWNYGDSKPSDYMALVSQRWYQPNEAFPQNTKFLWQIDYILVSGERIPSPVWGFETKAFPDYVLASIDSPDIAYSGASFDVSWTVANTGYASSGTFTWYDAVYFGDSPVVNRRRRVIVKQRRYLEPGDGYISQATVNLYDDDLGTFYVYVETDIHNQVNELNTTNNLMLAPSAILVRLTPPPDLVVDTVFGPGSTFSGRNIDVTWKIKNTGIGRTKSSRWLDRLYFSSDDTLDENDNLVGSVWHYGALASGGHYQVTKPVYINHRIFGNYYFIVQTDDNNDVYEHLADQNGNIKATSSHTEIVLTPPPDLEVTEISCSTNWFTAQEVIIEYTVTNNGYGSPYESWWSDKLLLVKIATNAVTTLAGFTYSSKLGPGESYSRSIKYVVPSSRTTGQYNVTVQTDVNNRVFEFNSKGNNKHSKGIHIEQRLPDLIFTDVSHTLQETVNGALLNLSYQATNSGPGNTLRAPWRDRISLVTLDRKRTYSLGTIKQHTNIISNEKYGHNVLMEIPSSLFGEFFLEVNLDYRSSLHEVNANNNAFSTQVTIPQIRPDLNVVSFNSKTPTVQGGDKLELSWIVENSGKLTLNNKNWVDIISLGRSLGSKNAIQLSNRKVAFELVHGGRYEGKTNVTIPVDVTGTYMLWIEVNQNNAFQEMSRANNFKTISVVITAPPSPDLQVVALEFQFDEVSNLLGLTWTAKNTGNTMLRTLKWTDQIVLENADGTITVGEKGIEAKLDSGEEYQATAAFALEEGLYGTFEVSVECDAFSDVTELNGEDNNEYVSPRNLHLPTPPPYRVQVAFNNITSSVQSGRSVLVSYTVRNDDSRDITTSSWTDILYGSSSNTLTANEVRNSGFQLSLIQQTGILKSGQAYTKSTSVIFPYSLTGNVYLYLIVDANDKASLKVDTSASDNLNVFTTPILASESPLSDIAAVPNKAITNIRGGQPFRFSVNITNIGDADVTLPFYNALYLSEDILLDPFDRKLAVLKNKRPVVVNDTIEITFEGFAPYDIPTGNYYFITELDSRGYVFEVDESNNRGTTIVTFVETVSTDISVVSVNISASSWTFNENITYDYVIRNNGSLQANGYKCDTTYLSDDSKWDITDPQVSDPVCQEFSLAPYKNMNDDKSYSTSGSIPLVAPSGYYGVVKTRSNIREPYTDNNIGFTLKTEDIGLPILQLDVQLTNVLLGKGKTKAYVVPNVPADETLIVELQTSNSNEIHDLYLRYDNPASTFNFDVFSLLALSANQEVVLENTDLGSYYLLAENNGDTDSVVSLSAKIAKFELRRSDPNEVSSMGNVTYRLQGTLFKLPLVVQLKTAQRTLTALEVFYMSTTEVYATFNMTMSSVGEVYDIVMSNPETSESTTLADSVQVKLGKPGKMTVSVQKDRALRAGETGTIVVNYQNFGNTDIRSPLLTVLKSGIGEIKVLDSDKVETGETFLLLACPVSGPGGILRPGSFGKIVLEGTMNELTVSGRTHVKIRQLVYGDSPHMYLGKKYGLKPSWIPNEVWDIVWDNFIEAVGTTVETLHSRLVSLANTMTVVGRRPSSVMTMIDYLLKMSDGALAGDSLIEVFDVRDPTGTVSDLALTVQRTYSPVISQRRMQGPFGFGWSSGILESKLLSVSTANITLWHERHEMVFSRDEEDSTKFVSESADVIRKDASGIHLYLESIIFTFDASSKRLRRINSRKGNDSLTILHNSKQQVQKIIHTEGSSITFRYNSDGFITTADLTDKLGDIHSVLYTYDPLTKQLSSVTADDTTVRYTYTESGDLREVIHPQGGRTIYEFNQYHILSTVEGQLSDSTVAKRWSAEYTWDGRILVHEYPQNTTTEYVYDENSVLAYVKGEGLEPIKILRSSKKSTLQILYGEQKVLERAFDGEKIESTSGASFDIVQDGDIKTFTDSNGNTIKVDYDEQQRLRNITYPDGTQRRFEYTSEGHVQKSITRKGTEVNYAYDDKGNMVERKTDGEDSRYTYDNKGHVTAASNSLGTIQITYNSKGVPSTLSYLDASRIHYKYNEFDHKTGMSIESNRGNMNVTYEYDKFNRLSDVWLQAPNPSRVLNIEYDERGLVRKRLLGNGAYTLYEYHPQTNWLLKLENFSPGGVLSSKFDYSYDTRGRIKQVETLDTVWKYRYDSKFQLIYWESSKGTTVKISYDNNKNRVKLEENSNTESYMVNNLNQYVSYGLTQAFKHDSNGNLIEKTKSGGKSEKYEFNSDNRLVTTEGSTARCKYIHDMFGYLYQKNCSDSQTTFLNDPMALYRDKRIGQNQNGHMMYYITGLQMGLIAKVNASDLTDIVYYNFDHQGSVVGMTDADGTNIAKYVYDPFGNILNMYQAGGAVSNQRLFLGQWGTEKQHEVDLYMVGDRFYDAEHGRFLSPDPLELAGKSTNFYCYSENNPVMLRDASGRIIPLAVIGVGAIIGAVTNAATYTVTELVQGKGGDFNWAGLAGATVSGAITGAGTTLGAAVGGIGGIAVTSGVGAIGGAVGYGVEQLLSGNKIDAGEAAEAALWNGALALVPPKMLGYKGKNFGKVKDSFLDTLTLKTETGRSIAKTLTFGNAVSNVVRIRDRIKEFSTTAVRKIRTWTRAAVNKFRNKFNQIRRSAMNKLEQAYRASAQKATDLMRRAKDQLKRTSQQVKELYQYYRAKAEQYVQDRINHYSQRMGEYIRKEYEDFKRRTGQWIRNTAEEYKNKTLGFFSDIWDAFLDALRDIGEGLQDLLDDFLDWIRSIDPNDMIGPTGYGEAGFLPPNYNLEYKIRYENDANATAPAQKVLIKYEFDEDLDMRTFKIGGFGFGNFTKELNFDKAIIQDVINLTSTIGVFVSIRAGVNVISREATWEIQALDPATGQRPDDPSIGFLPPNNGTSGQGYVTFRVKAKSGLKSMTRIDAQAAIYFDLNEPIETPPIFNTIDNDIPEVNVTIDPKLAQEKGNAILQLQKADGSSGVKEVDLYIKNGDRYEPLLQELTEDMVVAPLTPGNSYHILAVALDNVGNQMSLDDALVMVIDVPEFKGRSCNHLNNCSTHGNCSLLGSCDCDSGFYGPSCNSLVPFPDPPVLEASLINDDELEDVLIALHLQARKVEGVSKITEIHIFVYGFPRGFKSDKGTFQNEILKLEENEFGSVTINPLKDYAGNVTLNISAVVKDGFGNKAERNSTLSFEVQPVADVPFLNITQLCFNDDERLPLEIVSSSSDDDGSEKVHLDIGGIPDDFSLEPSDKVTLINNNTYRVYDWTGLEIVFNGQFSPFTMQVTAVSEEKLDEESVMLLLESMNVTVCEETTTEKETTTKKKSGTETVTYSICLYYIAFVFVFFGGNLAAN